MRYGVTGVFVALVVLLADISQPILPGGGVFLLLLVPVMVCAFIFESGGVALLLGMVGAVLLVALRGHPWLHDPSGLARIALYLGEGAFVLFLAAALRRSVAGNRRDAARTASTAPRTHLIEPLTRRERDVLRLAASGLSVNEIGQALYLSRNTVKSHLTHAYGKLGAHNRTEAVAAGLHAGCITPDAVTARAAQITAGAGLSIAAQGTKGDAATD